MQGLDGRVKCAPHPIVAAPAWGRRRRRVEPGADGKPAGREAGWVVTMNQDKIFLCEYGDAGTHRRLFAVFDDLSLTYEVIEGSPDGEFRRLRRHLMSLRAARAWADRYAGTAPAPPLRATR